MEADNKEKDVNTLILQETIYKLEKQNAQLLSQVGILQNKLGKFLSGELRCGNCVNPDPNIERLKPQVEMTTLLNSVVLHNTFKYLDAKDLRNMRLVCSTWNSVLATSRRFNLNLEKLISSWHANDGQRMCSPNLSRSLTVDIGEKDDLFWTRVISYFSEFHAIVENLKFESSSRYKSSLPTLDPHLVLKLFELFNTLEFKNLTNLSICPGVFFRGGLCQDLKSFINFSKGWKHLKLKQLEITVTSNDTLVVATPNLETTLQNFLNSFGVSLETLKIWGNFVLDLTNCRNLKCLKYTGFPYQFISPWSNVAVRHPTFEMENLNKLRLPRKDSLVEISLTLTWYVSDYDYEGFYNGPALDFELPMNFHKLETLTVNGLDLFRSLPRFLNKARVPNLKKLVLTFHKSKVWTELFQDLQNMDSVKEFIATNWDVDENILKNLAVSFPNLENLGFGICVEGIKEQVTGMRLSKIFTNVGTIWGTRLKELNIVIIGRLNWGSLLKGLYTIAKIEGLKKLVIKILLDDRLDENRPSLNYKKGGVEAFLNFLGTTARRMESVEFINFRVSKANVKVMLDFISKNKLPVKFINE